MSRSKVFAELASQDVSKTEFDVLDGGITTLGTVTSGTIGTGAVITTPTMTQSTNATGDVYYRAANGRLTRLAAGADGTVLTSGGAGVVPTFAAAAGGGKVSQVKYVTYATQVTESAGTYTNAIPAGTSTITMASASNTLLVFGVMAFKFISSVATGGAVRLITSGSGVTAQPFDPNRKESAGAAYGLYGPTGQYGGFAMISYEFSPAYAGAVIVNLQGRRYDSNNTLYMNPEDGSAGASQLTMMEIAG